MSKAVNIFLLFLLFPLFLLGILAGFDLNAFGIFEGVETPFLRELFLIGAGLIFILLAIRGTQRWMGLRMLKQTTRFHWMAPVSAERISRIRMYMLLENSYLLLVGLYFMLISDYSFWLGVVCVLGFVESLLYAFLFTTPKHMKAGLTKQAFVIGDRDTHIYYFSGLRKVSVLQQTVYLEYKDELTMSFPVNSIDPNHLTTFKEAFLSCIPTDKVYVSEKFHEL